MNILFIQLLNVAYSYYMYVLLFFFFFQAEDGIRDYKVTGVQTCALPIFLWTDHGIAGALSEGHRSHCCYGACVLQPILCYLSQREAEKSRRPLCKRHQIGRASCRERV